MSVQIAMPWHDGELQVQEKLRSPRKSEGNPTITALSQQAAFTLQNAPLLAIGILDDKGQPWTTVWGGETGFARPLGGSMIGIKTPVDDKHDPVVDIMFHHHGEDATLNPQQVAGKLMAGLTINLDTRKRVKLAGKAVAGAVAVPEDSNASADAQVQLVTHIDQSMGNCPKYLNRKNIQPAHTRSSELLSNAPALTDDAVKLVHKTDLFFVSSSQTNVDMDTNHRGGPAGFVRVSKAMDGSSVIVWPEYSGNRMYQTLGNLEVTPLAGLVFPDFDTGDVLYVTGKTETFFGKDANRVIPRSNLAVKLTVTAARFVRQGLPFRGEPVEPSPYNPRVRPLAEEAERGFDKDKAATNSVKLLEQTPITPSISRFKFSLNNPVAYVAGQWVALDFSDELDPGYRHMQDDDPTSLNDDYVRTFTVSSPPGQSGKSSDDNFECTVKSVGNVTKYMFQQHARHGLEIPMLGFGGDFKIEQKDDGITPFVAGGVGITPVLGCLPTLDMKRFKLFWTLHISDVNLAIDTIERSPSLAAGVDIYLTGVKDEVKAREDTVALLTAGVKTSFRRLTRTDLEQEELSNTWYMCVGPQLQKTLLEWLNGKEVIYESFDF
ncbi:MAG: hypothetical protein Q9162_002199 [Coniocarpon cinnabarinum]